LSEVARIVHIEGATVYLTGVPDIKSGDVLGAGPNRDGSSWRAGRLRVLQVRDDSIILREHAWSQVAAICSTDYLFRAPSCDDDVAVAADLLEDYGHVELANRLRTRLELKVSE